jgi:DNA ligase (NAD+)
VEASKQQPVQRVLTALGIRFVGSVVSGLLLDSLHDIDAIGKAAANQLETIDGIGPGTASAVVTWFRDANNLGLLEKLRSAGLNFIQEDSENTADTLEGFTFVVTGTLPSLSRKEAKDFIESHGGKVTGSVSGQTNYLLAGESAGSKLDKAKKLGVPIISESQMRELAAGE